MHAWPSFAESTTHCPVPGSHSATWQSGAVSGVREQSRGAPRQSPFWQIAFDVQMSVEMQAVPLGAVAVEQLSSSSSQAATRQGSSSPSVQSMGPPAWHTPLSQVSPVVQNSPSSHSVPSSAAAISHTPVSGLQTAR